LEETGYDIVGFPFSNAVEEFMTLECTLFSLSPVLVFLVLTFSMLLMKIIDFIWCRNETHEVIKYLEYCVHHLHNEDPGVHNLLLSLYAKQVGYVFL